jgi:predicted GNAT family acetyltransferase
MAAVYGSATINNVNSKGQSNKAFQDMIGTNAILRAASNAMQNGHIGAAQGQTVTPAARAALIAAQDTPAMKSDNSDIKWDTVTGTWVPAI